MRESYRMERYAQRAVRIRRDKESASRKIGDFLMQSYLAEGALLSEEFAHLSYVDRLKLIATSSELIMSTDGEEGINVVWGSNKQVLTHRLISPGIRSEHHGAHYLGSWSRSMPKWKHSELRKEITTKLEARVKGRAELRKQCALDFSLAPDDLNPLFLHPEG
ncbi:hypothetical protein IIE18_11150 [Pseudomonas sp. V1]|uniref:hypothetical protein n=1 Tax=Pseudomonas arcuscaelestis TaxID=2710591 RepID=UPI00193F8529|nr:hypothetical protein [Pseudomonas arcuscaelestis]MBM3105697.1 hypothetical protein [Pseudomonas arcuscaelestis]